MLAEFAVAALMTRSLVLITHRPEYRGRRRGRRVVRRSHWHR
jgi:hypothetical protein